MVTQTEIIQTDHTTFGALKNLRLER
jgi:hypothetical protein